MSETVAEQGTSTRAVLAPRFDEMLSKAERAAADGDHLAASVHALAAYALEPTEIRVARVLARALLDAGAPLEAFHVAGANAPLLGFALPEPWLQGLRPGAALRPQLCALVYAPNCAAAWIALGEYLDAEGRAPLALEAFRTGAHFDAGRVDAWAGLDRVARAVGAREISLGALEWMVRLLPDHAIVRNNIAAHHMQFGRFEEAIPHLSRALELAPDLAPAIVNMAQAHGRLGRLHEVLPIARSACGVEASNAALLLETIHAAHIVCDWTDLRELHARFVTLLDAGARGFGPFPMIIVPGVTAMHQRLVAESFARLYEIPDSRPPPARSPTGRRLRIAYMSSEFREHATAWLVSEIMELHDQSRFEIYGVATTKAPNSAARRAFERAFTRMIDIDAMSDPEAAALIRELGVDVLVDLNGYTGVMRPGVLALRPAPVQIQWLGFPGTLGASFVDALIGDPVLTPPGSERFYTERVLRLPVCYQPNDRRRPLPPPPARRDVGLPDSGLIFCSFNAAYKITPDVFDLWCELLSRTPGSVLWILVDGAAARDNLLREAQGRGVAPERLVFAPRLDFADHLARFRLADLFLDTFPCNAHTTASDALWCGVPVLTRCGETFASRVAASLAFAAGVPELVVSSGAEYLETALRLAGSPAELAGLRARLEASRLVAPLFDSVATTRALEQLYSDAYAHRSLASM